VHSYPWVLVRANDEKEARQWCEEWINSHLEGSAFDYGGPVDNADDPEFKTVIRYGDRNFMKVLRKAVEMEHASVREHWDAVKQFVMKFAACKDPPTDQRTCQITKIVAQGINGLIDAGKEVTYGMSAHEAYLQMKWLYEVRKHMQYRGYMGTSDAVLFVTEDVEVDIDDLLAGGAKGKDLQDLFLVRTDLHH
jgi:hypothetical protein